MGRAIGFALCLSALVVLMAGVLINPKTLEGERKISRMIRDYEMTIWQAKR